MSVQFPNIFRVDVRRGPAIQPLHPMFLADAKANRVGAYLYDGDAPVNVGSVTVSGEALLANGGTVALTGAYSGNLVYVDLTAACYVQTGPIRVSVTVTGNGITATVVQGYGNINITQSGVVIDPGTVMPSIASLEDRIEAAVATIPADYSALLTTIAPDYTGLSWPVVAGTYCWHSGTLYQAVQDIATAESWTAAHWEAAVIGNDLAAVRHTVYDGLTKTTLTGWESGNYTPADGTDHEQQAYIRNQQKVGLSTGIARIACAIGYKMMLYAWDLAGNYIGALKTSGIFDKGTSNYWIISDFDCAAYPNLLIKATMRDDPTTTTIQPSAGVNCYFYTLTDKTLTQENKPADAAAAWAKIARNIGNTTNMKPLALIPGYYALNGETVGDLNAQSYDGNYCCHDTCSPGDQYIVNGRGGTSTRLWAFANSNGTILSVSPENAVCENEVVIAPANAAYFYSDTAPTALDSYFVAKITGYTIQDAENDADALKYGQHLIANGHALNYSGFIRTATGNTESSTTWLCTGFIDISAFDKIYVHASNFYTPATAGLAFYDAAQSFISNSGVDYPVDPFWAAEYPTMTELEVSVPSGAKYVRASCRATNKSDFYILSQKAEQKKDDAPPTPVIFFEKNPATPSAGYANRAMIDKFIDAEDISICARVDVASGAVLFLGSEDHRGQLHASHVQYDFGTKEIRIYTKSDGTAVPSTVLHTVDISGVLPAADNYYAQICIGRKSRQLWVSVENFISGQAVEYTVDEAALNDYKYPAGWLEDRLVYGIISGTATFKRITAVTKAEPFIAFVGNSITEGFGIPYTDSWAYQVGSQFESFLCLGRSGGTIETAQRQVDDIVSRIKPKYVCVCIGTNGGNSASLLQKLCNSIRYYGAVPILCRIPMLRNASTVATINRMISEQNENTVGFDYATMTNGAQDTSKFQADKVHPNVAGATAMAERFWHDMGWIKMGGA